MTKKMEVMQNNAEINTFLPLRVYITPKIYRNMKVLSDHL